MGVSCVPRGSGCSSPYNGRMYEGEIGGTRKTWNPLWLPATNHWVMWWVVKVTTCYAVLTQWEKLESIYVKNEGA